MRVAVFDIGNVLIGWEPRNLYRRLLADDPERVEWFLENVCTPAWNLEQDRGRSFADGVSLLVRDFPHLESHIRAYDERWHETVTGAIDGMAPLVERLKRNGHRLYAITNFNRDKFRETRTRFPVLDGFDGIVVSGEEGLVKPDPAIYRLLFDRYGLKASDCVFIDDNEANVAGARAAGMTGLRFTGADRLAGDLRDLGFRL